MLQRNKLNVISYTKGAKDNKGGDVTERIIIPTFIPSEETSVESIDVSEVPSHERDKILSMWNEYTKYLERQKKSNFSFEDFISHTTGETISIKWRRFKESQIVEE